MSTPEEQPEDAGNPRHAGLGVRIAAALLDFVIMGVPLYLLLTQLLGLDAGTDNLFESRWRSLEDLESADFSTSFSSFSPANMVTWALLGVITLLLWVNWDGRTPGKKLLRIRIVSYPEYQPFSYGPATIRSLLGVVSAITVVLYVVIGFMVGLREDKRGFHDLIAKTCVIHDE